MRYSGYFNITRFIKSYANLTSKIKKAPLTGGA